MRGLIHFIVALILSQLILSVGFVYSIGKKILESVNDYLYSIAYYINMYSTYVCAELYNDIFIKKNIGNKFLFGKRKVSISYHIGKNYQFNSLTFSGLLLYRLLNWIEKDHCIKAIQKEDNV